MTTSKSPLSALKRQSDLIAKTIKAVERGEKPIEDVGGKIAASIARGTFTAGIVMDDKVITVEMTWEKIKEASEVSLSEMILKYMRGVQRVH